MIPHNHPKARMVQSKRKTGVKKTNLKIEGTAMNEEKNLKGNILVLSNDFFFIPRIEDCVRKLDFNVEIIEKPFQLDADGEPAAREIHLTEPLHGADGDFLRAISDAQPNLMIFDLSASSIPWDRWIRILKTSAATRRIPLLAFGPHVEEEKLKRAKDLGANLTVTRGKFNSRMADLIHSSIRIVDGSEIHQACAGTLRKLTQDGLDLIEHGEYFEAHEVLEEAWMKAPEPETYLLRTLLQVAVTYLQIERQNWNGAEKMLLRIKQWITHLPDECQGIDIASLRQHLRALEDGLAELRLNPAGELAKKWLIPIPRVPFNRS
jgi:predicted metal-dependent hydrolase